ncbi:MAG: hypothetical protein H8D67_30315 [Deltaproteobacteria bacterium]|nr:hypothetical protein [Deltaproteobacteria bacterium]
MTQSAKDTEPYSDADLEALFAGWFELGDETQKAELLRLIEIEIMVEVENQIKRMAKSNPLASEEDFMIDIEEHARELAFRRRHRDPNESLGDIPKRLRDYWNNPEKRKAYPSLSAQIRYLVWSVVREAIARTPRCKITFVPLLSYDDEGMTPLCTIADETAVVNLVDEELTAGELISLMLEEGGFSADERKYLCSILEWEGSSPPADAVIERKLGWYQSKAHRVKTGIKNKVEQKMKLLNRGR